MLKFPSLKNGKKKVKSYVHGFGGVNNSNNYREGECENCSNLDADAFPALRAGRGYASENVSADDLLYADGVARVVVQSDGQNYLYFRPEKDGTDWNSYPVVLTAGKKEIASAGGKIIVMPDKKVLDLTEEEPSWQDIEKEVSYPQEAARLYGNYLVFKKEEDFETFTSAFKTGDVISFSGGFYEGNETAKTWRDEKIIIREISKKSERKVTFDPYTFDDTHANETTPCTFRKKIPALAHLCSWNNRAWGVSEDGKIWASKYQDPTNFEYFDLTSADSFTLEAGPGSAFTGSCATGSYIAFFRQNKIHRITGTKPSNYRHTVIHTSGVLSGAERSLAVIDDIIYYEGKEGIYTFDGGNTHLISEKLGDIAHSGGEGAKRGDEYYISLKDKSGSFNSYIYHPRKGLWLRDGIRRYQSAVSFLGNMYFIDKNEKVIYRVSENKATKDFETTLRAFDVDFAEKKGYMRICIGYTKKDSGKVSCYISINGDAFTLAKRFTDGTEGVGEVRLDPNRGDRIRLRISGTYDATVKYVMREYHTHGIVI